jgi:DNA-binding Xre family transcriptional regulator
MCIIINGILQAMVDLHKNLSENMRKLRGDASQTAFAKKTGLNQASINRIELQQQNVTINTLQKLCERLKCKVGDLLD